MFSVLVAVSLGIYFSVVTNRNYDVSDNTSEFLLGEKPYSETTCICVFDLDHTLTCGYDRASVAVNLCKERNCKIAINTARPIPYYKDIKLEKLGLKKSDFKDDFYHGEFLEGLVSTMTHGQLSKTIADTKIKHLKTIQEKYQILDPKRIILFDDVLKNVEDAKKNGFSGIHANHPKCGMNDNVVSDIKNILD
jgi:hypothetical protein